MLRKELGVLIILPFLLSCSQVYLYSPVSGGQIVKVQENYTEVAALQKENTKLRIRIAGFVSATPKFAIDLENKTNQDLIFDAKSITGLIVENNIALAAVHCYKPRENKIVSDVSDFEVPCENQIKSGQTQRRYLYLTKFPESFKQYGKPMPAHHIRLTASAKSGIEIDFLFKLTES